ncbi:hypothetical protein V8B97DRAFT_2021528 [Scleroderma yunnanense]
MLGYPNFQIKNTDVATSRGYLLTRNRLDSPCLRALISLQWRSFFQNLGKTDNDPWKISVLDLTSAPTDPLTLAQGTIPWLFDDSFSCFTDFHVCFNVGLCYNHGVLVKEVVHTTCPDQCLGKDGPAPPGCVCTTVTALSAPKGKGEKCLILKGEKVGQIHIIKECRTKKQQVVLNNGTMLPFNDVC